MTMRVLGDVICRTRRSQLLTQEELSIAANLSRRTIQRLERGDTATSHSIRSVAKALGLEPCDICEPLDLSDME